MTTTTNNEVSWREGCQAASVFGMAGQFFLLVERAPLPIYFHLFICEFDTISGNYIRVFIELVSMSYEFKPFFFLQVPTYWLTLFGCMAVLM